MKVVLSTDNTLLKELFLLIIYVYVFLFKAKISQKHTFLDHFTAVCQTISVVNNYQKYMYIYLHIELTY